MLGPLYHLYSKEDKGQALQEAIRITKLKGVIFVAYIISDGCALFMREAINAMDDDTFNFDLKYHFATCERKDLVGITSHAIDIFRKEH